MPPPSLGLPADKDSEGVMAINMVATEVNSRTVRLGAIVFTGN